MGGGGVKRATFPIWRHHPPPPKDGTAPLPPLGPPRSGNGGAGLSPSLSGPSRRRRHARECGPTLPGPRRLRGGCGTALGGAREGRESAGKARGRRRGRGSAGSGERAVANGGAPRWRQIVRGRSWGGENGDGSDRGVPAVSPALTDRRVPAARQGPAAPVPRGGEAQAQEEAAGAEPQLLLHGRQVPRWAAGALQGPSVCPGVVTALPLPFPASRAPSTCFPKSLHLLPCVPPGVSGFPFVSLSLSRCPLPVPPRVPLCSGVPLPVSPG